MPRKLFFEFQIVRYFPSWQGCWLIHRDVDQLFAGKQWPARWKNPQESPDWAVHAEGTAATLAQVSSGSWSSKANGEEQ
jgi:hypothetical protein